jgi:CheY-like chemotaxis protein
MPNLNGYDFCRLLKDNIQLCHIPVVLVTANFDSQLGNENKHTVYFHFQVANENKTRFILKCRQQMKNCDCLF